MNANSEVFQVPSFARKEAYDFDAVKITSETADVYAELNQISEELEKCRLRNC